MTWPGRPDYPASLVGDPDPPGALIWQGRLEVLDRPCVATVGTRSATPDGKASAFKMGRDLADAGICVVSGLALGIDGAAHAGAVVAARRGASGRTVGVAASGPDVPYPRRHTRLWADVTDVGAVLSENLPGRPAQAWRFPTRNRIIAGLASLVVVVESHRCGGSLITAGAAIERGVEVRVVPGPVHSPASEGSNQLLYDGPGPVRHAQDVLDALGIYRAAPRALDGAAHPSETASAPPSRPAQGPVVVEGRGAVSALSDAERRVLEVLGRRPASAGQILARTRLAPAVVAQAVESLTRTGLVRDEHGRWSRCR